MQTPGLDIPLVVVYCLAVLGCILPLVFRGQLWLRFVCVTFMLTATLFAVGRVHVSPRMAVDRLQREEKTWTESFRDGSVYTSDAVWTAVPVFLLVIAGLTAMAMFPPKRR